MVKVVVKMEQLFKNSGCTCSLRTVTSSFPTTKLKKKGQKLHTRTLSLQLQ